MQQSAPLGKHASAFQQAWELCWTCLRQAPFHSCVPLWKLPDSPAQLALHPQIQIREQVYQVLSWNGDQAAWHELLHKSTSCTAVQAVQHVALSSRQGTREHHLCRALHRQLRCSQSMPLAAWELLSLLSGSSAQHLNTSTLSEQHWNAATVSHMPSSGTAECGHIAWHVSKDQAGAVAMRLRMMSSLSVPSPQC